MGSIGKQINTYDALIVGAGINGVAMLHHIRNLGLKVKILEAGGGVGGVWYWNRYPGARFDSESYSYGYSWSQEVLDEWDWTEHFSPQPQTEKYVNFVVDKFNMRGDIQCNSRVSKATYRDADKRWTVETENGETFDTKFFFTAVGPLNKPCMPTIDGIERFKGQWTHTARWPKEGLDYAGKRVAVIGTGATGVQVISLTIPRFHPSPSSMIVTLARSLTHASTDHHRSSQNRRAALRLPTPSELVCSPPQLQDLQGRDGKHPQTLP